MAEGPVVEVKQGKLQGRTGKDYQGKPYFSFQGIPYAKPPLGDLRFKAPQPPESWTGIRDATKEGDACYSLHLVLHTMIGSEDCLFLNVYTPSLPSSSSKTLPVMVWIHGGAFTGGSSSTELYSPEFLLPQDVVLVTLNYRLGLLGFMSFEDPSIGVPGNAGLKDQVSALKWVQENIAKFNGDANNVTIFGESAGASSVHYLTLSPAASGLFHKAILQSGAAISHWAVGSRSVKPLAKALERESASEREIYDIVKGMSSEELFQLQIKIGDRISLHQHRLLGPVIEPQSTENAFLTKHPEEVLKSGNYTKVPSIFGYCNREGFLLNFMVKDEPDHLKMLHTAEASVSHKLTQKNPSAAAEVTKKIKDFYFGGKDEATPGTNEFFLLHTDSLFVKDIIDSVRYQIADPKNKVFFYRLSAETDLNIFKKLTEVKQAGVCHADDLFYMFKSQMTPEINPNSLEAETIHRVTKLWATFARTGNPNPSDNDPLINIVWPPVEKDKITYLEIGDNLTVGVNPDQARIKFWDDIYGK